MPPHHKNVADYCDHVVCHAAPMAPDMTTPDMGCSRAVAHGGTHLHTRYLGYCDSRFHSPEGRRGHLDAHRHHFVADTHGGLRSSYIRCETCMALVTWGFRAADDGSLVRL